MTRTRWRLVLLAVVAASFGLFVVQAVLMLRAATAGETHLQEARAAVSGRDFAAAEAALAQAEDRFGAADQALRWSGPVGWIARVTPLVRVQVRAAETLISTGSTAAGAGLELMPVADRAMPPGGTASDAVRVLADAQPAVVDAITELREVQEQLAATERVRLLPPLRRGVRVATAEVNEVLVDAERARDGLQVLLHVTGADEGRSFLVLSQNPDEPRPTGGYMGTYGVVSGTAGRLRLDRYDGMGTWHKEHPQAPLPPAESAFPFRYTKEPQSLGNANTSPDWPTAAAQARRIWARGGEAPVDGVITYRPQVLVALLEVLGPTRVPGYPETVTAGNLDALLEDYTHTEEAFRASQGSSTVRKQFISDLARVVLDRALELPAGRLPALADRLAVTLQAGDAALWSADGGVQSAIARLGWDGAFRATPGDFYADAEFAFASKNGRALLRTFTHTVALRTDGSGTSSTRMVLRNTAPFERGMNEGSDAYLTPYGPIGGALLDSSDPRDADEPDLAGHPTAGWLRAAAPLGSTSLQVGWDAPGLAVSLGGGRWAYRLTWLPTPGHLGDTLRLAVTLPPGARWDGPAPPESLALEGRFSGAWTYLVPAP